MKTKKLSFIIFFLIFSIFLFNKRVLAAVFDPNYIISDEEMLNADAMSLADIQTFLNYKGGYIANHMFKNHLGQLKSAAQIIYDAANNYECDSLDQYRSFSIAEKEKFCEPARINPKVLLVLLQKEQSLIEDKSPTQKQLDWAMGYAVCDNCSMSDPGIQRWKGFGKQINSAALQFWDYMKNPHLYKYKPGQAYTVSNTGRPSSVIMPRNRATAALYNYTPHVYNGNFNFYSLWLRYFTRQYPNNSLLQVKGEPGVWLIKDGKRRPFTTRGALTSRFDINKIIQVNKSDLEAYPVGKPLRFPQYSLIRSPRGTVYLLVDDKRRGFASAEAFRKIGFNPEEIINADWDDINAYEEGKPITATSTYPTGALLQDNKTGGIYFVSEGTKAPLWDAILLKTKYKGKSITPVSPEKLASYKTVKPAIFNDGELVKTPGKPGVYVIDNGKKRPFTSAEIFEELGYKWENIISIPEKIINLYPDGEPIAKTYKEVEVDIIDPESDEQASSTTLCLNGSSTPCSLLSTSTLPSMVATDTDDLTDEINSILNP